MQLPLADIAAKHCQNACRPVVQTYVCKAGYTNCVWNDVQAKAASDARLERDVQEAEDKAEATAAEEARHRQQELESIDR